LFHQRTTLSADTRSARLKAAIFLLAAMGVSTSALAHTGTDAASHHALSMLTGVAHPFGGLDHLAAMVAVGFWSAIASRRIWVAPLAFANMLLVGALLGMSGIAFPAVEPLIAASVLVLGLLLATRAELPTAVSATLAGGFAVFHGMAHGAELAGSGWLAPLFGMVIGTVALHLAGMGAGLVLRGQSAWWARGAGAVVALTGSVLLVQAV
jgi:urease accessory protein